jgi:RNA polymerase sigma-70 factor (ECF subfamily)
VDDAAFDELYEREWPGLVGALTFVCGDRTEAADCVQEAFVRAWENRRRLDGDAGGWVRTVALRIAVSRWRKTRGGVTAWLRHHSRPQPHADVEVEALAVDPEVVEALRGLPDAQREALVMHHVMDMSVDDVAAVLGCPVGTVKARLARGRAAMAVRLRPTTPSSKENAR